MGIKGNWRSFEGLNRLNNSFLQFSKEIFEKFISISPKKIFENFDPFDDFQDMGQILKKSSKIA